VAISHRPYRDIADIDRMKRLLVAGRAASPHSGYMHVGDLDWQAFGPHGFPLAAIIHIWEEGGDVVGFALLAADGFSYQVNPDRRGSALEQQILEWGQRTTARWRESQGLEARCVVEAHADDTQRIALLQDLGYAPNGRGSVCFARGLADDIAEPRAPTGWDVRGLREEDVDSRATAQYEAFSPGSRTTPSTWRYLIEHASGYDAGLDSVVVTPDGVVASAALAWLDTENRVGSFEPVGTRPAFQRRGLGRAALLRGLRAMRDRGMETAIVGTNAGNEAAIALYQSVGFQILNTIAEYKLRP
jgi:ribosomal protein S18 acetylase RimI-like enzyme